MAEGGRIVSEERGSSMVEMIGVIGVLGVLAASVWTLINSARARFRLSQGVLQLQSLEKGVSRFYASAGNYDGLKNSNAIKELIDNRIPPTGMATSENKLRHAFGGEVEIANVPYANEEEYGSSSDSFTITFKGLDKSQCREMASIVWMQSDAVSLVSIKVGDTKYVWPNYAGNGDSKVLPVDAGEAMTACADAPKDITWEFR